MTLSSDHRPTEVHVFGATGYTGQELVTLLERHPHAQLISVTSEASAGTKLHQAAPVRCEKVLSTSHEALSRVLPGSVSFLCLPHGQSAKTAKEILDKGGRVVDLSADFRLKDKETYGHWYQQPHPHPELLELAHYGLSDLSTADLRSCDLVANPGCYPTSIVLALAPLIQAGIVSNQQIVIDSKSGTSGAGRAPKTNLLQAECGDDFSAYSPGRSHRHVPEIEEQLNFLGKNETSLIFTPHLLPVPRGILSTIYAPIATPETTSHGNEDASREKILGVWKETYSQSPFVWVMESGLPHLKHAVRTNRCAMGCAVAGNVVILVSVIDNLIKGAAGQALQNFNRMLGLNPVTGMEHLV